VTPTLNRMPPDLGAPADRIIALAGAVTDDQLSLPTPCGDQEVATMLAHIIGSSIGFRDGAAKVDGPTTSTPPGPASPERAREEERSRTSRRAARADKPKNYAQTWVSRYSSLVSRSAS
jgi:hypothetical protein